MSDSPEQTVLRICKEEPMRGIGKIKENKMDTKILNKIEPIFWKLARAGGTYPSGDERKYASDKLLVPLAGEISKNPDIVLDRKSAYLVLMECATDYCARLVIDLNEYTIREWENFVDQVITQVSTALNEATAYVLTAKNHLGDTLVCGLYYTYEGAARAAHALCEIEVAGSDEPIHKFPREKGNHIVRSGLRTGYFVEAMIIRSQGE